MCTTSGKKTTPLRIAVILIGMAALGLFGLTLMFDVEFFVMNGWGWPWEYNYTGAWIRFGVAAVLLALFVGGWLRLKRRTGSFLVTLDERGRVVRPDRGEVSLEEGPTGGTDDEIVMEPEG